MRSRRAISYRTGTAFFALATALPAYAQNDGASPQGGIGSEQSGDIIVTARKRAESLQDVPISVDAFSSTTIEREGISNIEDVIELTPSLNFDEGFSPQDNRVSIRGLPGNSGRPAVGILIDGIDYTTESIATAGGGNLMDVRLFDFERIEVVKGPQSALYGRSAFGGAVNYIPKEPGDHFGGSIAAELGLYGRAEIRGAVDIPVDEAFAVRVNGTYTRDDGYYRNSVTGNHLGGYEAWGGTVSAKWEPNSGTKIIARLTYSDDKTDQRAAKYYGLNNGLSVALPTPANVIGETVGNGPLPASVPGYPKGVIRNENVPIALSPDPADPTGQSDYPGVHTKNIFAVLRGEFDLGFADLSTWTGYARSKGTTASDVDYFGRPLTQAPLPAPGGLGEYSPTGGNGLWQFDISTKVQQFNQEIRLSNLDADRFRWAVGALYWWEKVRQQDRRILSYGIPGASAWLNLALLGGRSPIGDTVGRTTEHISGYALAEYDLLDNLTFSVEGRYAKETYDYLFGRTVAIGSTGDLTQGPRPIVFAGSGGRATSSTTYFAPRAILTYKPVDDVMFYASAARGIKPGGISQVGTVDVDLGTYAPERLSSYEIGGKLTLWGGKARINFAFFHMDYKDKQAATLTPVPFSISPQGALSVTTNAGKATVDGQEVEFFVQATPEFSLSGSYTHLNPKYTDFVYNTTSAFDPARTGKCNIIMVGTQPTCEIDLSGNQIENAARHSAVVTATYTRVLTDTLDGFLQVTGKYRSSRWSDQYNAWKLKANTLVDVKFGVETSKWDLTFYVDNVFDDRTITSAISLLDVAGGSFGPLNMIAYMPDPRRAGVRLGYKF